jgi:hypothetical protein
LALPTVPSSAYHPNQLQTMAFHIHGCKLASKKIASVKDYLPGGEQPTFTTDNVDFS